MKSTKIKLIDNIKKQGYIAIDKGELFYNVTLVNDSNFPNMTKKLKAQLLEENLYGTSYIGHIDRSNKPPFSMETLPIFGNSNKYVTKWFKSSEIEAVNVDLKDKYLGLLKRIV